MRPCVPSFHLGNSVRLPISLEPKDRVEKVVTPRFSTLTWANPVGTDIVKICAKDYPFERRFLWKQLGVLAFGAVFWLL